MAELTPHYSFEGDEVFALFEGKVIASGTKDKMAAVEQSALEYLESLNIERKQAAAEEKKRVATHIITPNGVKGEILGRAPSIWGEQVTARFENGIVDTFDIHAGSQVDWVRENKKIAGAGDPVSKLSAILDTPYEHDKDTLRKRLETLAQVAREARAHIANGAPYHSELELDKIVVAAEAEGIEVGEVLDHLESADMEAYAPPAPFEMGVAEQASLGRGATDNWLDVTAENMLNESAGTDYEKLLQEGPSVFVTELDDGALADTGVTRDMAIAHITSKTAGYTGDDVDEFRQTFVARTEVARRHELADRKTNVHKEAAQEQEVLDNVIDDALFL